MNFPNRRAVFLDTQWFWSTLPPYPDGFHEGLTSGCIVHTLSSRSPTPIPIGWPGDGSVGYRGDRSGWDSVCVSFSEDQISFRLPDPLLPGERVRPSDLV
ncbi:MAG: hypothetical protein DIKNOCCD_01714 [bacterium]|nr:hypothetical protein [bacterium]